MQKKKLEPIPGQESDRDGAGPRPPTEHPGRTALPETPPGASIEDSPLVSKGMARRMAMRKKKMAEDAALLSEELQAGTEANAVVLTKISDRVVEMEHHIVGSNEAANLNLDAATNGRRVAASFQQKAKTTGQVLTTLTLITHSILADIQLFKQLTERLSGVSSRSVRYMQYLTGEGAEMAEAASKIHDYADEINVLAFNMTLESSRIGDEAAAIAVVAKQFHKISEQSESAALEIQKHQLDFKSAINRVADLVTTLERDSKTHSADSSRLASEVGHFVDKMRELQDNYNRVQQLADKTEEMLNSFSMNSEKIRSGSEEMSTTITEISAGVHEQTAAMAEIARRTAQMNDMNAEYRKTGEAGVIDAIVGHMTELYNGIRQIQITIHQIVDSIHQVAASASEQQSLSLVSRDSLREITATGDQTLEILSANQESVSTLTRGMGDAQTTIATILKEIEQYEKKGEDILDRMDGLRTDLDAIEQALNRLRDHSAVMVTTGLSGEIEAVRLGQAGEMFSTISREVSELGEQSSAATRKALLAAGRAKERIDLIKRSVFDVGEIVRTGSEQRRLAESNLKKVAGEAAILLESADESVDSMRETLSNMLQMSNRMTKLNEAAGLVVAQSSETMEFVREQVEAFDDLAETLAAFSEQTEDE
ncbi:MAG: methyl-accepting chemotaxis protein [Proteobacteria bacterium]|nr:methyl-accepting chemotaxis protein [Pseudomonadota bacterium]